VRGPVATLAVTALLLSAGWAGVGRADGVPPRVCAGATGHQTLNGRVRELTGDRPAARDLRLSDLCGRLSALRLISYYPSGAPWTRMWTQWDPAALDRDFAAAASLGCNTVRLIVHPGAVGYPVPSPGRLSELAAAVGLAQAHGLAVQLTLFDWFGGYRDTAGSDRWSAAVLGPYRNDRRLAFVEVKNELDPGDPAAVAWARHELPVVQSLLAGVPVTISVDGTNPLAKIRRLKLALASAQPDFYDVHYYGPPGAAAAVFAAARDSVAPLPLIVGETGTSSDGPDGEARQDGYLRTVESAARAVGLPPAAPWILKDIDPRVAPPLTPGDRAALDDGLLHTDGRQKPAARTIRAVFTATPVPSG
jgi:hypothetical protein